MFIPCKNVIGKLGLSYQSGKKATVVAIKDDPDPTIHSLVRVRVEGEEGVEEKRILAFENPQQILSAIT